MAFASSLASFFRSAQIIGGSDAALADPVAAGQIAGADAPFVSAFGPQTKPSDAATAADPVLASATPIANEAVLDLHGSLETGADQDGTPGTVHGITALGETTGLGKIGQPNLLTDVLDAPAHLAMGDAGPVTHIPADGSAIAVAVQDLGAGIGADVASGAVLADPVGGADAAGTALASYPLTALGNDIATAAVSSVEGPVALIAPHTGPAIAALADTSGLGAIGGGNVLSDVVAAPTALAGGDTAPLAHLPADLGASVTAAGGIVDAAGYDIAHSTILAGAIGSFSEATGGVSGAGSLASVVAPLDASTEGVVGVAATTVGLIAPQTGPALADLAHAAGLGDVGGSNIASDLLAAPAALAGGDTAPLTHLPADLGTVVTAAGGIGDAAGYDIAHSTILNGAIGSLVAGDGLSSAGGYGAAIPTALDAVTEGVVGAAATTVGLIGPQTGPALADLAHAAGLGDVGGSNIASDIVAAPVALAGGDTAPLTHLPADLGTVVTAAGGGGDAAGYDTAHSTILNGLVASLAPLTPTNGSVAAVEAPAAAPATTVAILPDGSFHFADPIGGSDASHGALSALSGGATGLATAGHAESGAGAAPIDLPIAAAHADPLSELAHAVHHA